MKRLVLPGLLVLACYYALFGGEYTVLEMHRARVTREAESRELARLRREVDSLRAWADSLADDPAVLERVARERYGMILDGEVLYRFAEPPETPQAPRVR